MTAAAVTERKAGEERDSSRFRAEEEELGIYEDKGSGTDLSDTETLKHELDEVSTISMYFRCKKVSL